MLNHKVHIHILLVLLSLIGAINWGFHAFNYNLVTKLSEFLNRLLKSNYPIEKAIYIIVAISALILAYKRQTWLPFLGETVFPRSLVNVTVPEGANKKIQITVKPNTKVIYWAANNKGLPNSTAKTAYGAYKNSGVTISDANGIAELAFIESDGYTASLGHYINKHVHYRTSESDGILSKVKTFFY
jgi:uncharacterized membrane protein YuzA (DUF378 family)